MKRRILSILTALVLAFGLCSPLAGLMPEAKAASVAATGGSGDDRWTLYDDGTLSVFTLGTPGSMGGFPRRPYDAKDWFGVDYKDIKRIVIEEGSTLIRDALFRNCAYATEAIIPDSVTSIWSDAFYGCERLKTMSLPSGLTAVSPDSFYGTALKGTLVIPDGVEIIGYRAFKGADYDSIVLPVSIKEIRDEALEGVPIDDIYYAGTEEEWQSVWISNITQTANAVDGYFGGHKRLLAATVHFNSTGPGTGDTGDTSPDPGEELLIPAPILDDPACTKEGVSLSWTLPLELPEEPHAVDGFYILRKTAGGSYQRIGQVGEYTHLYTDTSVQGGQTYTYTVQAYYQDQTGDYDQRGKTITYVRPVTVPVAAEVRKTEFRIEGGEIGLTTDTLWTGAQSKVYIYIKEDVGIEHGSDPGYVVLTDRNSGKQLWRSDTIHYYSSDSIAESHHFDFVFEPKECDGGYLPSGTEVQFQIRDEQGDLILTCDCETFPLQLWSFSNPGDTFDQAFLEQFYSESRAKAIFKLAKADTLGGDGLCVGMALTVSLINSDGIGDIGFEGCTELSQAKKDTPLTGAMKGYTVLDLIKACQARQYFDSIVRQRKENREDLTGLIEAVESYERGIGAMPVVIISVPQENDGDYTHALAAYAAEEDEQGNMRIDVYDPNHPDIIGSYLTIYNPGEDDAFWLYREQFKGGEGEMGIYDESLLDAAFKKYGLTYFTSRSYPMQQEDDIWVNIAGYDFSALKDGGLEINVLDPDRFQGLSAAWVSGQGTLNLPGLTGQAEIADDETAYTIDADGGSASLTLKEGVDTVKVTGDGTLTITCTYEGERGTVTTRFSGKSEDGVTVDRTGDTVRFSGGDSGTVTVTYENGKTWTEQVEQGKELAVTADGKNEPSTTGAAPAVPDSVRFFLDISPDDYFYDAVAWAVENGVTAGTGANTFSPHRPCTRGEIVTLLWRSLGLDELSSRSTYNPFVDVDSGDYFCDAVLWAAENGITTGTSADHFSPNRACSRAEVVTLLWRSHFPLELVTDGGGFSDVHEWDYYWFPVNWAVQEGITTGTGASTFSPDMVCTRAQVVTFLYRYFEGGE